MSDINIATNLPDNYEPLKDQVYMSPHMLCYFKGKLEDMHDEILQKENYILHSIMGETHREADHVDQSSVEELSLNNFIFQEHEDAIRIEIEEALQRINNGTYGYCIETGEPIGIKRLLSVPTAKYSVEIQEEKEREGE